MPDQTTKYGFIWGPAEVNRITEIENRGRVLEIRTKTNVVQVYVSEGGRSIRVWRGGKELVDPS